MTTTADDDSYFKSYQLNVHRLMLQDSVRTNAYLNAIKYHHSQGAFKDKVVLDIGTGTGILSMFVAKHTNAQRVIAVEASEMAHSATKLVQYNGLDKKISIVHSRIEDAKLPVEKVDIIISEWMGFYLLHESMLPSVLFARDKWLNPGGLVLPTKATLHLAMVDMEGEYNNKVVYWRDVCGLDFTPLMDKAVEELTSEPQITVVDPKHLCSDPQEYASFDFLTVTQQQVKTLSKQLKFTATRDCSLTGLCCWFTCDFGNEHNPCHICLPTSAHHEATHWKQTVFWLPNVYEVVGKETVQFRVDMNAQENTRYYIVSMGLVDDDDQIEDNDANKSLPAQSMRDVLMEAVGKQYAAPGGGGWRCVEVLPCL